MMSLAIVVTMIEAGATYASLGGEPMAPVEDWAPTRRTDAVAFGLTAIGCAALFAIRRFPTVATIVAAAAYSGFILREYEFGMTLPAMAAIFLVVAGGGQRIIAIIAALGCLAASLVWLAGRTATVSDPGVSLLAWVAFGTVCAVFFFLPLLAGEIVRTRRALHCANRRRRLSTGSG